MDGRIVNEQEMLQEIMIGLLLLGAYFGALHRIAGKTAVRQALPVAAAVLLIFFVMLGVTLIYVSRMFGMEQVLAAMLLVIAFVTFGGIFHYLFVHFRDMNPGAAAILLVYLIVVGCITVFSRNTDGDHATSLLRMNLLSSALQTRSFAPIRHILQNVALFVPMGILLPCVDRDNLDHFIHPVLISLTLSVLIEGTQLLLNLGQADLTDIAANVLGGALGYLMYCPLRHLGMSGEENVD